ncbi:T9SS type A sorting domain-containing protein [Bacteroides salyersiae]|nr:T9SS type A sorting domain-containing protein [Bacteroides salyersiae]
MVDNTLYVSSDENVESIVVTDISGKVLEQTKNTNQLSLKQFSQGIYIVSILSGNNMYKRKNIYRMNLLKIRIIQIAPLLFWGVNVVGQSIDNHFLFNQFRDATILYKNKKENRTALNYNKATEEMIYISPEGKNMALYPIDQIDTVYFDKRKFVPVDNRFYEVLSRNKYTFIRFLSLPDEYSSTKTSAMVLLQLRLLIIFHH